MAAPTRLREQGKPLWEWVDSDVRHDMAVSSPLAQEPVAPSATSTYADLLAHLAAMAGWFKFTAYRIENADAAGLTVVCTGSHPGTPVLSFTLRRDGPPALNVTSIDEGQIAFFTGPAGNIWGNTDE